MKEVLENLEIGEGKVKLSKEDIKTILAKNGEIIKVETKKVEDANKTEIDALNTTITDLKGQLENVPKSDDIDKLKETIKQFEEAEATRKENAKAEAKEVELKSRYESVLGDKQFINEYTGNDFYAKFKANLELKENKGKGDKEVFDNMTKDVQNIFKNPNPGTSTPGADGDAKTKETGAKATDVASIVNEFSRHKK